LRGDSDQTADPIPVFECVFDQEIQLGSGIGRGFGGIADVGSAAFGRFYKKLVVANERHDFAVAINRILAEHFLVRNDSGIAHLVCDEFDKTLIRSHVDAFRDSDDLFVAGDFVGHATDFTRRKKAVAQLRVGLQLNSQSLLFL
jgi:hypothetical protein